MTDTAIEARDEAIAEAIVSGRSLRSIRKEFSLTAADVDAVLERLWPIDTAARLRMIKTDLGKLDKLTEVFYSKALAGCVQSGLLEIRIWERKHELLGCNSPSKIEIVQAPPEAPDSFDRIYAAIKKVARHGQSANGCRAKLTRPFELDSAE